MKEPWKVWISLALTCLLPNSFALRTSNDQIRTSHLRPMTKAAESEALPRRGTAIRENEIAAIFRGVAYGAPTQGRPNITTPGYFTASYSAPTSPSSLIPRNTLGEDVFGKSTTISNDIAKHDDDYILGKQINHSLFVHKVVFDTHTDSGEKVIGGSQEYTNSAVFSISTYSPLPTSHTIQHIISSENQTLGGAIKDGDDSVWISGNSDSYDLRWNLGLAWWLQVYVSVGLFTLLALVALCLMARFAVATHLLPRPYYLVLHILIFFTAFLRSLHTLHDAHGLKHLFPVTLLTAIEETIWPCLTSAIAVVLVAVLRAWRYPRHPHLALTLALITALHLLTVSAAHISLVFFKEENLPFKITVRVVTVAWGGAVGVGGMWAVWQESKNYSSHLTDIRLSNNIDDYPDVVHPARLVLTSTLTQLMLTGLHLCMLLVPTSPESHIWVWWCCISAARGLEFIVGSTLVSAAAFTLAKPRQCFTFSTCCQKRTVEIIHPTEIKMIHPMGVYTLQPTRPKNEHAQTIAALSLNNSHKDKRNHSSLDYVTSDFQLVWNHNRQRPVESSSTLSQRFIPNDIPRAHILPVAPRNVMEPFVNANAFSTLPRNSMYISPPSRLQTEDDMKNSTEQGINYTSKSSTLLSGSSGSSKLYSSPQIPLRTSRSWDELSTSHVYEDPMRAKPGSVDEGLSDLSDMNSDNINDLFFSESGSPVLLRPTRRSRRRHNTACYISAHHFTAQQQPVSPSRMHCADELQTEKPSTAMPATRQLSTQVPMNLPLSPQGRNRKYSKTMAHTIIKPPLPFLSDSKNTSPTQCPAIHSPSPQVSSTRFKQSGVSRSKVKSKSEDINDY